MKQFLVFGQTRGAKGSFRAGQGRAAEWVCFELARWDVRLTATCAQLRMRRDTERAKVELSVHRRLSELTGRLNSRSKGHYYTIIIASHSRRKEGMAGDSMA